MNAHTNQQIIRKNRVSFPSFDYFLHISLLNQISFQSLIGKLQPSLPITSHAYSDVKLKAHQIHRKESLLPQALKALG